MKPSSDWRLLLLSPLWFWDDSNYLSSSTKSITLTLFQKSSQLSITIPKILTTQFIKTLPLTEEEDTNDKRLSLSLLDLPELPLDCILDKLSPTGLCSMATVCSYMRDKCTSDYIWEKHMNQKWGRVIGQVAYREWQWFIATKTRPCASSQTKNKGFMGFFITCCGLRKSVISKVKSNPLPVDSIMALYAALESGKFWFPAQVYNRENGHAGFMLSCYDAHLSYDSKTDTFQARYSPHGRRMMEENITWDRLRAPPIDNPAHVLHVSECLDDLKPGDHIEIQWRRNKEFPYGWWYGVVGHLESCDQNKDHCYCHCSDVVILEFNQYTSDSRWRRTIVNRKDHREEGNEADGFYAGIRKVYKEDEISMWKHNAVVSRALVISCTIFTVFFGNIRFSYQDDILGKFRIWKLIVSVLAFSSTPELLFDHTTNLLTSGPYGLIFSSFIPFYFDIPVSTRFRVAGVRFSDKTFIYLAGLQLFLSSWKTSILPGMCGIITGSLYRLNIFGIRKMRFPDFLTSFFSRLSLPSIGSPIQNIVGSVPSNTNHSVERTYPSPLATVQPPEESVAMLVSMGFDQNSARHALVQARNDINTATNILLEAQSH
ncbi:hypothetical protein ACFE04_013009 [Oxalis oulophora]